MAISTMELFKVTLLMMLFYSVSMNILVYSMPSDTLDYVTGFSDLLGSTDLESVSTTVQESVEQQTNLPVVELGALVFYSGNILIDLILNFAFAIPQMISLIITGLLMIFSIDAYIINYVQLFATVTVTVFYFIGVIQLLTGIRSGRIIA